MWKVASSSNKAQLQYRDQLKTKITMFHVNLTTNANINQEDTGSVHKIPFSSFHTNVVEKRNMNGMRLNILRGFSFQNRFNPTGICLIKFNNRNTRTMCEIYSKLTIKTPERQCLMSFWWCLYF